MNKIVMIFAEMGTSRKIAIVCSREQTQFIMHQLNKKFEGNWVWVDELKSNDELLLFSDGMVYEGFDGKDRYSDAIHSLNN